MNSPLLNDLLDLSNSRWPDEDGRPGLQKLDGVVVEVIAEFEAMCVDKALSLGVSMPQGVACCSRRRGADRTGRAQPAFQRDQVPPRGAASMFPVEGRMPSGRRNTPISKRCRLPGCGFPTPGSGSRRRNWRASSTSSLQGSATASGLGGTGLGLSICSEIVAAHKRAIHARSNVEGRAISWWSCYPCRRSRCDGAVVGRIDTMGSLVIISIFLSSTTSLQSRDHPRDPR